METKPKRNEPNAVSPRIEAFAFPDEVRAGIRTRLLCGVSQGDLPLEISWSKDGRPLMELQQPMLTVTELDKFSSVVTFTNLSAIHSGFYQCTARNAAGKAHYGTQLYVKGKPDSSKQPNNQSEQSDNQSSWSVQLKFALNSP